MYIGTYTAVLGGGMRHGDSFEVMLKVVVARFSTNQWRQFERDPSGIIDPRSCVRVGTKNDS